ncbi:hypothetical protein AC578_5888 [Pseudocercospora eumusae]|uniref:Uncharacterized protein n=1 Tax=Pseudocercospora eumusae TaxID=321146 RepID=A0A139HBM7_9PEZI|nr:hypothetical protein AC578_5888 [Pseudocercospora eumusae]
MAPASSRLRARHIIDVSDSEVESSASESDSDLDDFVPVFAGLSIDVLRYNKRANATWSSAQKTTIFKIAIENVFCSKNLPNPDQLAQVCYAVGMPLNYGLRVLKTCVTKLLSWIQANVNQAATSGLISETCTGKLGSKNQYEIRIADALISAVQTPGFSFQESIQGGKVQEEFRRTNGNMRKIRDLSGVGATQLIKDTVALLARHVSKEPRTKLPYSKTLPVPQQIAHSQAPYHTQITHTNPGTYASPATATAQSLAPRMLNYPANSIYASGLHAAAATLQTPSSASISPMLFHGEQRSSRRADHLRSEPGMDANKALHYYQTSLYSSPMTTHGGGQPQYTASPAWQSPAPAFAALHKSSAYPSQHLSSSLDPLAHPSTPASMPMSARRSPQAPAKPTYTSSQAFQAQPPHFNSPPAPAPYTIQHHTTPAGSSAPAPSSPTRPAPLVSNVSQESKTPEEQRLSLALASFGLRDDSIHDILLQRRAGVLGPPAEMNTIKQEDVGEPAASSEYVLRVNLPTKPMPTLLNKLMLPSQIKPMATLPNNLMLPSQTKPVATLPNKHMLPSHAKLMTTLLNNPMLWPHTQPMTTLVNKLMPSLLRTQTHLMTTVVSKLMPPLLLPHTQLMATLVNKLMPTLLRPHAQLMTTLASKLMPTLLRLHAQLMPTLVNMLMLRSRTKLMTTLLNKLTPTLLWPHTQLMPILVNKFMPTLVNKFMPTLVNKLMPTLVNKLMTTLVHTLMPTQVNNLMPTPVNNLRLRPNTKPITSFLNKRM